MTGSHKGMNPQRKAHVEHIPLWLCDFVREAKKPT